MAVPPADGAPGRSLVGSVLRAMRLLDMFERGRPEMTLAEFARRAGYSKSTTYRLLVTLTEAGWLERTDDAAFRLTVNTGGTTTLVLDDSGDTAVPSGVDFDPMSHLFGVAPGDINWSVGPAILYLPTGT